MLQLRLNRTDLRQERKETPVGNLCSLVSQMDKYLTSEQITSIKRKALKEAEEDYSPMKSELTAENLKKRWSREERWAIEYAKAKYNTQRQITKSWKEIFFHFYPSKSEVPPKQPTTQCHNSLRSFSDANIENMKEQVAVLILNNLDPLQHPIPTPDQRPPPPAPSKTPHTGCNQTTDKQRKSEPQR